MKQRDPHEGFVAMPERLAGERDERLALSGRMITYGVTFLDDYLLGMLPHDLVLLGAPSGLGKTELALSISAGNAQRGNPTDYFALEAEPRELERRRKYGLISRRMHQLKLPGRYDLRYRAWHVGLCEHLVGDLDAWADRVIAAELSKLRTFYRGKSFDAAKLAEWIIEIHERTTLITVDHLHYVDTGDGEDENRALHDAVKIIRDVVLRIGRPILLVAHLRKKNEFAKKVVPDLDDFHGTSNITKICTQVIVLERATDIEAPKWYLAPTYIAIRKDRLEGAPRYVALAFFNLITRSYAPEYTLGRVRGAKWEELELGDVPSWAKNHRAMTGGAPSTQANLNHPNAPEKP